MKKLMMVCVMVLFVTSAQAGVVSVTSVIDGGAAPDDLDLDQVENAFPQLFEEQQGVELGANLAVDIASPGSYIYGGTCSDPGTIPAGTIVSSYLVHYDPLGTSPSPTPEVTGCSITFDRPVLGLIFQSGRLGPDTLGDSDGVVGSSSIYWTSGTNHDVRGFDLCAGYDQDPITLSADRRTVSFDTKANTIDEMRILVAGEMEVDIDIKPTSCPNPLNVKSGGVLPVAILGTGDFDVSQIDPASVALAGAAPLRWDMEDVATPVADGGDCACNTGGPDGFTDLTLKFNKADIVAAIGDVEDGDVLSLMLTGKLKEEFGGTAVAGSDCVVIIKKGR